MTVPQVFYKEFWLVSLLWTVSIYYKLLCLLEYQTHIDTLTEHGSSLLIHQDSAMIEELAKTSLATEENDVVCCCSLIGLTFQNSAVAVSVEKCREIHFIVFYWRSVSGHPILFWRELISWCTDLLSLDEGSATAVAAFPGFEGSVAVQQVWWNVSGDGLGSDLAPPPVIPCSGPVVVKYQVFLCESSDVVTVHLTDPRNVGQCWSSITDHWRSPPGGFLLRDHILYRYQSIPEKIIFAGNEHLNIISVIRCITF